MKMVSRITAIGLAGVAICYLGLSGYVWYHDNKRSKQADVQASAVSENNKVLGFLREKDAIIAIRLRQNYPPIIIFPARNS